MRNSNFTIINLATVRASQPNLLTRSDSVRPSYELANIIKTKK